MSAWKVIITPARGNPYAATAPLTIGLLLTVSVAEAVFPVRLGQAARTVQKRHSPQWDRLAAPRTAAVTKSSSTGSGTMLKNGLHGKHQ